MRQSLECELGFEASSPGTASKELQSCAGSSKCPQCCELAEDESIELPVAGSWGMCGIFAKAGNDIGGTLARCRLLFGGIMLGELERLPSKVEQCRESSLLCSSEL
mmetsp:Transcript_80447/g.141961  ORF Transcript_80447/g.141961 Transcript_80447/m.141961 type:complete len:106 (-) Transcript_80447:64-381(-)